VPDNIRAEGTRDGTVVRWEWPTSRLEALDVAADQGLLEAFTALADSDEQGVVAFVRRYGGLPERELTVDERWLRHEGCHVRNVVREARQVRAVERLAAEVRHGKHGAIDDWAELVELTAAQIDEVRRQGGDWWSRLSPDLSRRRYLAFRVNARLQRAVAYQELNWDGATPVMRLHVSGSAREVMARQLAERVLLGRRGTVERTCEAEGCFNTFGASPSGRPRRYCSVSCGNRERQKRRRRRRADSSPYQLSPRWGDSSSN